MEPHSAACAKFVVMGSITEDSSSVSNAMMIHEMHLGPARPDVLDDHDVSSSTIDCGPEPVTDHSILRDLGIDPNVERAVEYIFGDQDGRSSNGEAVRHGDVNPGTPVGLNSADVMSGGGAAGHSSTVSATVSNFAIDDSAARAVLNGGFLLGGPAGHSPTASATVGNLAIDDNAARAVLNGGSFLLGGPAGHSPTAFATVAPGGTSPFSGLFRPIDDSTARAALNAGLGSFSSSSSSNSLSPAVGFPGKDWVTIRRSEYNELLECKQLATRLVQTVEKLEQQLYELNRIRVLDMDACKAKHADFVRQAAAESDRQYNELELRSRAQLAQLSEVFDRDRASVKQRVQGEIKNSTNTQ